MHFGQTERHTVPLYLREAKHCQNSSSYQNDPQGYMAAQVQVRAILSPFLIFEVKSPFINDTHHISW